MDYLVTLMKIKSIQLESTSSLGFEFTFIFLGA